MIDAKTAKKNLDDLNINLECLGKTREDVKKIMGRPTDIASTTKKYPRPLIYRYGNIEYWFESQDKGVCVEIWKEPEDPVNQNQILLGRIKQNS